MNVNVTKIERLSNGIIQFYNGSEVVDSFSITSSVSVLFESNLAKSISFISNVKTLSFNVYNVLSVYGATSNKIYSSGIDPSDTSSAYISRLYDIYAFIISDVIQGCCPGPTFVGGFVATYPSFASFPATGQESVIYIDESTNEAYFWDGTTYQPLISISAAEQMATIGRNSTGSTLYKGTVIYISGSTGNRPNYVKAQANSEATSAGTFGVILADIPNNSDGYAVTIGTIDNLDTRSTAPNPFTSDTLVDGDTIYLSPTTAGYVTNVKPYAPDHLVYVGKVVRTSPTNGTIVYRIQNGYELDEIHDVAAQTPSNNDGLFFESATSLWKNKSISTVLGYTPFNLPALTSGSVLFSNGTTIAQDNANLFWDDTNNRLGVGTATPAYNLDIIGSAKINNSIFGLGTTGNILPFIAIAGTGTVVIGGTSPNTPLLRFQGSPLNFFIGSTQVAQFFATTGNLLLQNGGTFTDAGYRLDVNGSVRATGSISAASAIARGTYLNQTLVATANNDVLVGLDIAPTFTTGAFTGVTSAAIRVGGNIIPSSNGVFDLGASTRRYQNGWFSGSVVAGSGYFSNLFFGATNLGIYNSTSTQIAQIFSTGNLTLQSGGTFTDVASSRLTINSTTQGFLPPRMTTTEKNAIASPAVGLVVYDTTLNKLCVRGASAWETITSV